MRRNFGMVRRIAHNLTTLWIHMSTHLATRYRYYAITIARECFQMNDRHRNTGGIKRGQLLAMQ
jgi:hypothetical protein